MVTSRSLGRSAIGGLTRRLDALESRCSGLLEERDTDRRRIAQLEQVLERSREPAGATGRGAVAAMVVAAAVRSAPPSAHHEARRDVPFPHVPTVDLASLPSPETPAPALPAPPAAPEPQEPCIPLPAPQETKERGGEVPATGDAGTAPPAGALSPRHRGGRPKPRSGPQAERDGDRASSIQARHSAAACPRRLGQGACHDPLQRNLTWALARAARLSYRLVAEVAAPALGAATSVMVTGASRLGRSALSVQYRSSMEREAPPGASAGTAGTGGGEQERLAPAVDAEERAAAPRVGPAAGGCPAGDAASEAPEALELAPPPQKETLTLDDPCEEAVDARGQRLGAPHAKARGESEALPWPGPEPTPASAAEARGPPTSRGAGAPQGQLCAHLAALLAWRLWRGPAHEPVRALLAAVHARLRSSRGRPGSAQLEAALCVLPLLCWVGRNSTTSTSVGAARPSAPPLPPWALAASRLLWPAARP